MNRSIACGIVISLAALAGLGGSESRGEPKSPASESYFAPAGLQQPHSRDFRLAAFADDEPAPVFGAGQFATANFDDIVAESPNTPAAPAQENDEDEPIWELGYCPPPWKASVRQYVFWQSGRELPPLATTSPIGTLRPAAGVLSNPDTTILFGNGSVDDEARYGIGLSFEHALDCCDCMSVGVGFLFVDNDDVSFIADSDTYPILGVPFFNAQTNLEASALVGFPGENTGSLNIQDTHEVFGTDVYLKKLLYSGCNHSVHLMMGYNYYQINNNLGIQQFTLNLGNNVQQTVTDTFDAENEFHGGTIGLEMSRRYGCWSLNMMTRVSLGNMHQTVNIDGSTFNVAPNGNTATLNGGLFAQTSNIGSHSRNQFAVVPETRVNLSYCLNDRVEASVGYSLLFWNNVAHAGEQIDRNVNLSQLGPFPQPPLVPVFDFQSSTDWLQGLEFTLTYHF